MGLSRRLRKVGIKGSRAPPEPKPLDPVKISFKFDGPGFAWPAIDPPPLPHIARTSLKDSLPSLISDSGSEASKDAVDAKRSTVLGTKRQLDTSSLVGGLGISIEPNSTRPTTARPPKLGSMNSFTMLKPTMYKALYGSVKALRRVSYRPITTNEPQSPSVDPDADTEIGVATEFCFTNPDRPLVTEVKPVTTESTTPQPMATEVKPVAAENITHRLRYPSLERSERPSHLQEQLWRAQQEPLPNFQFIDNVPSLLCDDDIPKTSLGSLRKLPPHRVDYSQYVSRVPRSVLRDSHHYPSMPSQPTTRNSYVPAASLTPDPASFGGYYVNK